MQRIEEGGLIVSCDYCATDWDGQSPVIEGHRGAIICLECVKLALQQLAVSEEPYSCVLCLREKIPVVIKRWHHPNRPDTFACQACVMQAAEVFDRDDDVPWKWERA